MRNTSRPIEAYLGRRARAALVFALLVPLIQTEFAAASIGPVASPGRVRPYAPQNVGGTQLPTRDEALAHARSFNVITALQSTYRSYVADMKSVNPAHQLFVYLNGTFTFSTSLAEASYAHDAEGNRIETLAKPITYLLDPSAGQAIEHQKRRALDQLAYSGYDGVYVDVLGPAALSLAYVSSLPINPATGEVWTNADWLAATTNVADKIREAIAPRPIFCNGLRNGFSYFSPTWLTEQLLDSDIGGCLAEAWLRPETASIDAYPNESAWKSDIDMLVDAEARNASVFVMTKMWTNGTKAQKDAWHKFALASYLLGNGGRSWFFFTYERGDSTVSRPAEHVNLGNAFSAYAKVNGVYERTFSRGKVLVNPTKNTVTVSLDGVYRTLDGRVLSSVALAPNSAEILLRQVQVLDIDVVPKATTATQGSVLEWLFPYSNTGRHSVSDGTGMGLFDSGPLSPGSVYSFGFTAAGVYLVHDAFAGHTGSVRVPLLVQPGSGSLATSFAITTSSAIPPIGFVFDLQLKRPNTSAFVDWQVGQVERAFTFVPDVGVGTYSFRARLRNAVTGKSSGWSWAQTITVA